MKTKLTLERPNIRVYTRDGSIYVGTSYRNTAPYTTSIVRWNYNQKHKQ